MLLPVWSKSGATTLSGFVASVHDTWGVVFISDSALLRYRIPLIRQRTFSTTITMLLLGWLLSGSNTCPWFSKPEAGTICQMGL